MRVNVLIWATKYIFLFLFFFFNGHMHIKFTIYLTFPLVVVVQNTIPLPQRLHLQFQQHKNKSQMLRSPAIRPLSCLIKEKPLLWHIIKIRQIKQSITGRTRHRPRVTRIIRRVYMAISHGIPDFEVFFLARLTLRWESSFF